MQSKAVIRQLRSGIVIDEDAAEQADQMPHIDDLRTEIGPDDTPWLLNLADSPGPKARSLAISLFRNVRHEDEVKQFMRNLWERRTDFETRNALMWRLLDDTTLDRSFHLEAYRFVQNNWQQWLGDFGAFRGSVKLMDFVQARLDNPVFPESKAWAYLCGSMAVCETERDSVCALLAKYVDSGESIVSEVVRDLLARLNQ